MSLRAIRLPERARRVARCDMVHVGFGRCWRAARSKWGQLTLPQLFFFEELVEDRFVIGSPEDCWNQLKPYIEELGVTHFVFRTHFLGMPLSNALASMRLMSDELLPALHAAKPPPLEKITGI